MEIKETFIKNSPSAMEIKKKLFPKIIPLVGNQIRPDLIIPEISSAIGNKRNSQNNSSAIGLSFGRLRT